MKKFNPKCITENRDLAYTTTGHLTPCCWVNDNYEKYLKDIQSLEMHIDNFDSIEDILLSKPWRVFFDMLMNNPDDAPQVCKKYCGSNKSWNEIEGFEQRITNND